MKKRFLSILLLVSMLTTMLPTTAFAAENVSSEDIQTVCTQDESCLAEAHEDACPMAEENQPADTDASETVQPENGDIVSENEQNSADGLEPSDDVLPLPPGANFGQGGASDDRGPGMEEEVLEGKSDHMHVMLEGGIFGRIFYGEYSAPDVTKQYKLRIDLPPNYTVDKHALGGGTKTIMTLPEDTPYFGAAKYERLEWIVKNEDGDAIEGLEIGIPQNEIGLYDFEVLSKAMIQAGADADKIQLPYVISLIDENEEVVEQITLDTTSDLSDYSYPDNIPYCEEEVIQKVYAWFSGSTGYIDMMYPRGSEPESDGWLIYDPYHYPVTNLRSYVPYDDDRKLTPSFRNERARYVGDQELDGTLYAVFEWSDFWTYPEIGKISKYSIDYMGPLADMGRLSYQMPEDYKPGDTYTFTNRQIKFGYTELAKEHIIDHIKLPERYVVPEYVPIEFHMTDTLKQDADISDIVDEEAFAQGFDQNLWYQLENHNETRPTKSYQDVVIKLDFSEIAEGIDGGQVQTLQPTEFNQLDTRGLKEITYTLSGGETRTLDLMRGMRKFDIPEGQHVTMVKIWYEQIDRSTTIDFNLKMFHPMLKETKRIVSHGIHVTASGETIFGGENTVVAHGSVQGPDVLQVYPRFLSHPASKQSVLADGKEGLDGCARDFKYNQIIRFVKYGNKHMRNYENARLDIGLDPLPMSKLRGIELTEKLYAGIGTIVDKVEVHYTTNKHQKEQVASTIVDRNETTAFDGVGHYGHMAILLDLAEDEYVTSASIHLGTIYGEKMPVSAQGWHEDPEDDLAYGFTMLFDMKTKYHSDPDTKLGSAKNSEPMNMEGVDAWTTKVSFHSDSTERDEKKDGNLTSTGHTYFGDRITYRISNDRGARPSGHTDSDIKITFTDEKGEVIKNNSGQISVPQHIKAKVESLVFWEDYKSPWMTIQGDHNDFVDRNMWGEPSRRIPRTGVTMDGYLYLQVNRDFEISNVVINPNATADYETSVPTLVKKIAIGPEATQKGFRIDAYGDNYDPLDLESVLYIYKIENNRTPVNHLSMDVYASENAKLRKNWNPSYPDEANRNTKIILKTAVSYNEAFSEWEAEGSSAKQQSAVLGIVPWMDDIGVSFMPVALDPNLRDLEGIPACDAQAKNDKVFHEYGFVLWSDGFDYLQNYSMIPGLKLSRTKSAHLDSMGAKAATDDLTQAESVTEYGKTVKFVRDEMGKLLLAVKLSRPQGKNDYTQIQFTMTLPRAGEMLDVNGEKYQSDFSVYLDPTRFKNHLGRLIYKTNKKGDKIPPRSVYGIEVTRTTNDAGASLGTGELENIKNPETIKTLTTAIYSLDGAVGAERRDWDEYMMFYLPVTVEFHEKSNVDEGADTKLRPSAYVGFESAIKESSVMKSAVHIPVELRYENAYDIRVITGYDKNENGLDDEQYYGSSNSPTCTIEAFDQNDQLLTISEPTFNNANRTYSLTVPDTVAYLKVKNAQYSEKTLAPSIIPDFDNPIKNRLTKDWIIPITDTDKERNNLIYRALFVAPPTITAEDVTLNIAESQSLKLKIDAAPGYQLSYDVADQSIASIDSAMKQVTGQKVGTTTYTVTVTNPSGLQASATAQITVTMPTVEVTGTKTWVDYDDMYGLRPNSIKLQLYDGDIAVGEPVKVSAADNWEYTWVAPKYDDTSREIYYTVKEIGSYPNYTSKPTADGRGVINTLDSNVLIGSVSVSKTTSGGDGTFTFRLVGPRNTYYEGVVSANGTIDKWTHNNTGTVVEKLPVGTYTLYELPADGYYLDSMTVTTGAAESINGGQGLRFTISESNPTVKVSAKNVSANGGSITVTHEIKQGDLKNPNDQFTFVLKSGSSEIKRITLSANGTYTFHDLDVGSSYSVTQIVEDSYADYVVSVLNTITDPGKVDPEKKQYTFTPTADHLNGRVAFRNVNADDKTDPTDPPEPPTPDTPKSAMVTFRVVNGTWADGSSVDKTVEVTLIDGHGTLDASQIPNGMKPDSDYEGGAWDAIPNTAENAITGDVTYIYTFTQKTTSGGGSSSTRYTLHYESNGGTEYKDERYDRNTVVKLDKSPSREGHSFTGWYADKELTKRITEVKMTSNKTVYAGWDATEIPEWLNGKDHFAYVVGYEDGTVHPMDNISRAEVATIFFRLLNEDIREENLTDTNNFVDVSEGMWCNTEISTMAKLGIIKGRSPEEFAPNAPITRAEFAAICARFDTSKNDGDSVFTDISGHWAEDEIERAATLGWIMGYTDKTFRPQNFIKRAEAMAMINRVLHRLPENEDDLLDGMNVWPDNKPGTWYYLAVQEATNSHDFTRKGDVYEHWIKLTADPDWSQYR